MRNLNAKIQSSYPHSDGTHQFCMRILDSDSGELIVEVSLDSEWLMGVLAGGSTGDTLEVKTTSNPERLGKTMVVHSQYIASHRGEDGEIAAGRKLVSLLSSGWETGRIDRTNRGPKVVVYKWVEESHDESE